MLPSAVIGVSDHGGWAVLVTSDAKGTLLDRRRVELVDEGLPRIPHHVEAQALPLDQAIELIDRVRASAEHHAHLVLDAVARDVPARIIGVALRQCPALPPTIAERIADYRSRNVADWVMYRKALACATEEHGWQVFWYEPKQVLDLASVGDLRRTIGPPWTKDHKIAMSAAIAAVRPSSGSS